MSYLNRCKFRLIHTSSCIFYLNSREEAGTITIFEGHIVQKKSEVENEELNEDTEDAEN